MAAKTLRGLEEILAEELKDLGAGNIRLLNRAVGFSGNKEMMYKANYFSRFALKILKPICTSKVKNDVQLYNVIRSLNWNDYLDTRGSFAVESIIASSYFSHSQYVTHRVKDAIVDQFKDKYGKRPSVDTDEPDLKINIHIADNDLTVSLDSSGESLHKRGYRREQGPAPLNEVLAAGLIRLTGWKCDKNFIDPMCGSGTLPIEAALMAYNIPPGAYRKSFAFENWPDFEYPLFENITGSYNEKKHIDFTIAGSDISENAIRITKHNIKNAFLDNKVIIKTGSIELIDPPEDGGIAVINPPYGERLKPFQIEAFYTRIGDALKKKYAGYEVWLFTSNKEALKHIGLRTSKRLTLYNGPLECKYHKFDIFKGAAGLKKSEIQNSL